MQKVFLLLIILFLTSISLSAKIECDIDAANKGLQSAINICASVDYHKVDKVLNDTYKQLLKIHKSNKTFIKNLITAQKAWIKFRDAEVNMRLSYSDMPGNYGTMNSMLRSVEMQLLTEERTNMLQKYIKDGIFDQLN